MTFEINHCRVSGTVRNLQKIPTRTGTLMVVLKICCRKEFFKVVGFKNLAAHLLNGVQRGDPLEVAGRLQIAPWMDQDGTKHIGFEIVAEEVKLSDGTVVKAEKRVQKAQLPVSSSGTLSEFNFAGGPF